MRIGRPAGGLGNRQRVAHEKKAGRERQLQDLDRRSGRDLVHQLKVAEVPRASEEEVRELSNLFNAQMVALRPRGVAGGGDNFFRLFKAVDLDGEWTAHVEPWGVSSVGHPRPAGPLSLSPSLSLSPLSLSPSLSLSLSARFPLAPTAALCPRAT